MADGAALIGTLRLAGARDAQGLRQMKTTSHYCIAAIVAYARGHE